MPSLRDKANGVEGLAPGTPGLNSRNSNHLGDPSPSGKSAPDGPIGYEMLSGMQRAGLALVLLMLPACARSALGPEVPPLGGNASAPAQPSAVPLGPAAAAPSQKTPEQFAQAARQSVLVVSTPAGQGTGFSLRNGRVVTSLRTVMGHSIIFVTDAHGQRRQVSSVRTFDSERDLAILNVGAPPLPGLELGPPELPAAGEKVVVLRSPPSPASAASSPPGAPSSVSNAVVGGARSVSTQLTLLQIDGPIPKNSFGAPVLNVEGKVVAVLGDAAGTSHPNLALPVHYLKDSLAKAKDLITMSTFGAITAPFIPPPRWLPAASDAKKRRAFPISVAGFAFGMSVPDAHQACNGKLTGDPNFATCSFKPVDVPYANNHVSMRFEAGRLTRVYLRGNSWDDVASATLSRYGQPGLVENRNGGSWDPASGWKKGTASRATWWLDGGMLVVFSQDGRDLALIYVSAGPDDTRSKATGDGR